MAEISWGEKVLVSPRYSTWTIGLPPWSTTLNGQDSISFLTVSSSNLRPIKRLLLISLRVLPGKFWSILVLNIEDSILRVHSSLILCRLTNETFLARKRDEGGSGEATLFVGNCMMGKLEKTRTCEQNWVGGRTNFDIGALVICNARIGRA